VGRDVRGSIDSGKGLRALIAGMVFAAKVQRFSSGLLADVAALAHNDYNNYQNTKP
jgi:uncharacterized membrane protein YebE (DUF533 family)